MSRSYFLFLFMLFLVACQPKAPESTDPPKDDEPVRGIWLTNVDSEALFSQEKIEEAVAHCHELGFNTIFVVSWNRAYTLYPSQVMDKTFGRKIDPKFDGRDPLQEVITAAHARGMKVYAWFEFGFSCSYQESDGGFIIREKPEWAAIDSTGNLVSKNGFQWMNAFDSEVQDFVLSLLKEAVQQYELDGIQGDDRLPALPSEAGYDSNTLASFQKESGTVDIPAQYDEAWIDWRAQRLNEFMGRIHREIKKIDPDCKISVSPSIYPWSKEQYLQDWPTWVKEGWVDMVCPQVYRYDLEKYRNELRKIVNEQVQATDLPLISPGILLKVGDYVASDTLLQQMVQENRKFGINGEVFFFYEGLKKRPTFFDQLYE
ncbi:MAG: family 10 glycosylhydrolase [Saprospiraceae bacterium]|nr:family 10 glycosylhydrolase [Saprospiraceae bacterium]